MRVGIHQINYLPWMGYFNKIAKSDVFILMDEVQMTDGGMMQRNRVLNKNGEISFLTVAFAKKGYMDIPFSEVRLNQAVDWQKRQLNFLWDNYHKFPYWEEVYKSFAFVFEEKFETLQQVNERTIRQIMLLLDIQTPLIYQSSLSYDRTTKNNDLVLELCKAVGADCYLSGNGAKKYMEVEAFRQQGINVQFQTFDPPPYTQKYSRDGAVPGLSILDVFLNCGIEETRRLFWESICNNEVNA